MSSIVLDSFNHALLAQAAIMRLTPDGSFKGVPTDDLLAILDAISKSRETLAVLEGAARAALKGKLS